MKRYIALLAFTFLLLASASYAQDLKSKAAVPAVVKTALHKKYPEAKQVCWEREKGNYEANWGGKSGEDNSVQLTPSGNFVEIVKAIPVSSLPTAIITYVKEHYKGTTISEAGRVTDAAGKLSYEVEVHGKDLLFDGKGNFVKKED